MPTHLNVGIEAPNLGGRMTGWGRNDSSASGGLPASNFNAGFLAMNPKTRLAQPDPKEPVAIISVECPPYLQSAVR